jgi:predicted transcriptional regulator
MARRGEGVREIARQLGCSRNTVRRYLRDENARRYGPREGLNNSPTFGENRPTVQG